MKTILKNLAGVLFLALVVSCNDEKEPAEPVPNEFTKVIAHRGAWLRTGAPQNSLASLQAAIKLGCYGSEFDVRLSKDNVPFVSAADSVTLIKKDTITEKMLIELAPFDSLAKITLSNQEKLPTLKTYLEEGKKQSGTRLILKMIPSKVDKERSLELARRAVAAVKEAGAQAVVDYGSADYEVCKLVRQLEPTAKVSYLGISKLPDEVAADKLSEVDYTAEKYVNEIGLVKTAQDLNLTANVWLVNSQALMEYLIWKRVNFITTDEPELLARVLKGK